MRWRNRTDTGPALARAGTAGGVPHQGAAGPPAPAPGPPAERIEVATGAVALPARLVLPRAARALVVLARAGGGERPGRDVGPLAAALGREGFGTLSLDLLTEEERDDRHNLFDIVLLARRTAAARDRLRALSPLPVGYYGEGAGAPAVLAAAAADPGARAVVCVGDRPELAGPSALARVRAPTLFVVGGLDARGPGLNRLAADWLCCPRQVAAVPGTAAPDTDPSAAAAVARLTRGWFAAHLDRPIPAPAPAVR
ncbi:alpha/beta hydrolase [Streptomyces sp. SCSIO 75703]|uniref:alpha/beta hydrolase n=1 Tax=Streptomyces sp. SCSIO 75703 TaxID=3112165 RepID=UPI0030CDF0E8